MPAALAEAAAATPTTKTLVTAELGSIEPESTSAAARGATSDPEARTDEIVRTLLRRSFEEGWAKLPIGERVARFARAFEGTPYADATLEGPGPERCRVTALGFDCVTLMETALGLARVVRGAAVDDPNAGLEALRDAITFTRYRGGQVQGYTSRLHYTAEWIAENEARGVFDDVTRALGGEALDVHVGFMSAHPERYAALARSPALVDSMRRIEAHINAISRWYIPRARVAGIESKLQTGDLVAITTSIAGLDYAHTGLIVRDASGQVRFFHASSARGEVVMDVPLSQYLAAGPRHHTGISVLRPRGR